MSEILDKIKLNKIKLTGNRLKYSYFFMVIFNFALNIYLYSKGKNYKDTLLFSITIFTSKIGILFLKIAIIICHYGLTILSFVFLSKLENVDDYYFIPLFIFGVIIYPIVVHPLYLKKLLSTNITKSNKNFINNTKNIVIVNISLNSLMIIVSIIFLIILNKNNIE
jgi:hypothetical protein